MVRRKIRRKMFSVAEAIRSDDRFHLLAGPFPSFVAATKFCAEFAFGQDVWLVRHNEDGTDEVIGEMGPDLATKAISSP